MIQTQNDLEIYVWGRAESGLLGLDVADGNDLVEPTCLPIPRGHGIRQIKCGAQHTALLTFEGKVIAWGVDVTPDAPPSGIR